MSATTSKGSHRRYSKAAEQKVEKVMHERKRGTLRSGRGGPQVTSRKQAIAIGLSEARKAGAKVPARTKRAPGSTKRPTSQGGKRTRRGRTAARRT